MASQIDYKLAFKNPIVRSLMSEAILECFVFDNEKETQKQISKYLIALVPERGERLIDEVLVNFDGLDYNDLKTLYDEALQDKLNIKRGRTTMEKRKELLNRLYSTSSEPLTIYDQNSKQYVYKVLSAFEFEGKHYAKLRNLETGNMYYYRYEYDAQNDEERLFAVEDAVLAGLLRTLGY